MLSEHQITTANENGLMYITNLDKFKISETLTIDLMSTASVGG